MAFHPSSLDGNYSSETITTELFKIKPSFINHRDPLPFHHNMGFSSSRELDLTHRTPPVSLPLYATCCLPPPSFLLRSPHTWAISYVSCLIASPTLSTTIQLVFQDARGPTGLPSSPEFSYIQKVYCVKQIFCNLKSTQCAQSHVSAGAKLSHLVPSWSGTAGLTHVAL